MFYGTCVDYFFQVMYIGLTIFINGLWKHKAAAYTASGLQEKGEDGRV